MKKIHIGFGAAFLIFCPAEPLLADTACTIDPARSQMALTLSADALAIRNKLFLALCPEGQQPLVDISDPTLAGRLERPHHMNVPAPNHPIRQNVPGSVLVSYVIEADGSVQHVTVLESSGYKQLDEAAVEIWSHSKYGVPGKLDGQPVRVLSYSKVPFTFK